MNYKYKVKDKFNNVEDLLKGVMTIYPSTRYNDTLLYLRSIKMLGVKKLEDAERCDLSVISVHKTRQRIQNVDGEFLPPDNVIEARNEKSEQMRLDYIDHKKGVRK